MSMSPDDLKSVQVAPPAPRGRLSHLALLAAAGALTLGVLPYAYGRTLVLGMLLGRPESLYLGLFGAGVLAALALTAVLARRPPGIPWHRLVAAGVVAAWALTNGALIWLFAGSLIPRPVVALLFVAASLWVVWLAWLPYWPLSWRGRLLVLALLGAVGPAFPLLLISPGLTGDAAVDFTWRWQAGPEYPAGPAGPGPAAAGEPIRLAAAGPDDYPQFLGPRRLAVLPEARLGRDWEGHPPRLLWRRPVGAGWGSFAVVGDYAFTQEQRGDRECVACYRVEDGAEAWVHADAARFDSSLGGPGPRATPTVAGGRVYTVGAKGLLNCLDGATGRALWSVNILKDHGDENLSHGVCASPLVTEGLVVVSPTGADGISLAAYDRETGKRVWQGGRDRASYGSPLLAEWGGVRQVLLYNSAGVSGHDLDTGTVLWSFPWANREQAHCSQPIPDAGQPGQVFVSTGYGKGAALFQVEGTAGGAWSTRPLWESREMKTKFTTPVLHGGHVYGLDDGFLACVDLGTGRRLWKQGRYGHGQVLLAGDLLLVQAEDGRVVLVEPSPQGPRELGRLQALAGKTWNNPALAGRFLLVRNDREAACYEVPPEGAR
jgi:outer membrane protein assembly factor BamB